MTAQPLHPIRTNAAFDAETEAHLARLREGDPRKKRAPPPGFSLTRRQYEAFAFIVAYRSAHGRAPTRKEIAAGLGLKFHGAANNLVARLIERGWLEHEPFKASVRPTAKALAFISGRQTP